MFLLSSHPQTNLGSASPPWFSSHVTWWPVKRFGTSSTQYCLLLLFWVCFLPCRHSFVVTASSSEYLGISVYQCNPREKSKQPNNQKNPPKPNQTNKKKSPKNTQQKNLTNTHTKKHPTKTFWASLTKVIKWTCFVERNSKRKIWKLSTKYGQCRSFLGFGYATEIHEWLEIFILCFVYLHIYILEIELDVC